MPHRTTSRRDHQVSVSASPVRESPSRNGRPQTKIDYNGHVVVVRPENIPEEPKALPWVMWRREDNYDTGRPRPSSDCH